MPRVSKAVLELRELALPAQLGEIFTGSRFLTVPCLKTFLNRCDSLLVTSPADGLKVARAAPNLLELAFSAQVDARYKGPSLLTAKAESGSASALSTPV